MSCRARTAVIDYARQPVAECMLALGRLEQFDPEGMAIVGNAVHEDTAAAFEARKHLTLLQLKCCSCAVASHRRPCCHDDPRARHPLAVPLDQRRQCIVAGATEAQDEDTDERMV
eukprot:scaffold16169_cov29-Tisochrysis_lutea.AAC.2